MSVVQTRDGVIGISPLERPDVGLVTAINEAGALGVLDVGRDPSAVWRALSQVSAVRIPEGVMSVKPQPKPGWKLTITRARLAQPVDAGHGRMVSERVSEVAWSGGLLPDEQFDEFRIMMKFVAVALGGRS